MHTPDQDFGARLRKARRDHGISQHDASNGIVTASFLSLIESGKRVPSPKVAAALAAKGAKRISISLLRDLSAQQFVDALQEGMAHNHSEAEMAALKERMKQLSDALLAIGEAKSGTAVQLDWLPESGTRLTVNGQVKGKDIAGDDFYKALLKIWLGGKPVQDDLKQALLGKAS